MMRVGGGIQVGLPTVMPSSFGTCILPVKDLSLS